MTLNKLRLLAFAVEIHLKKSQDMLKTSFLCKEYHQKQISESTQHLFILKQWIRQMEGQVYHLESCFGISRNEME